MLSLSLKWHRHGNVAVVFMSAVPMVFSSALTLATFVLVIMVAHFNSWNNFYLTFFKSFQSLGLGVKVSIRDRVSIKLTLG